MVLDTNIIIAYLGGEQAVVDAIKSWRAENVPLFVSSIAECELLSFPNLTKSEEEGIEQFIREHLVTVPFEGSRARRAAMIRRKVRTLKIPDAAIAALALELGAPLVTRNVRDFKNIPELVIHKL